jgi:hypothetical protein
MDTLLPSTFDSFPPDHAVRLARARLALDGLSVGHVEAAQRLAKQGRGEKD